MDRERLRRIRNYQNTEFYPALVLRPASILITMLIGDWRWITPNVITFAATVLRLSAAGMFLVDDRAWLIAGAFALQAGAVLDAVDGTLARYRRTPSNLGFFYDTVSDAITWFATLAALGWLAFQRTSDAHLLIVAGAAAYALMVSGYMRSVVETADERRRWKDAVADPVGAVARNAGREEGCAPPERTPGDWVRWFVRCIGQVWRFHEMDLFFWVGLFVILDRIPELLWLLAITQTIAMMIQFVARALRMRAYDAA